MTDDAQRARRRAHNTRALERCNAMGRTAGSVLWQPLENRGGEWFMPDGAELAEPPVEWRSERLSTILDEMDAMQAVASVPTPVIQPFDEWKAAVDAAIEAQQARTMRIAGEEFKEGEPVFLGTDGKAYRSPTTKLDAGNYTLDTEGVIRPAPSTISLEDLEKALLEPDVGWHMHVNADGTVTRTPKDAKMPEPTTIEPVEPMLQFFAYGHLPESLQEISKPFGELAEDMVRILPRNPERSAGLRKLLEAKDCAVRARLYK